MALIGQELILQLPPLAPGGHTGRYHLHEAVVIGQLGAGDWLLHIDHNPKETYLVTEKELLESLKC